MKAVVEEYESVMIVTLTAETVEDAQLLVRLGMNTVKPRDNWETVVRRPVENQTDGVTSTIQAKLRRDYCGLVPRRV